MPEEFSAVNIGTYGARLKYLSLPTFSIRPTIAAHQICLTAKLLLDLASIVILGSESHGTHDHILLSDGSVSLLRTGSRQIYMYHRALNANFKASERYAKVLLYVDPLLGNDRETND
jgi:hypothetical protein